MADSKKKTKSRDEQITDLACCPELVTDKPCDVLDFHYRLIHTARLDNRRVFVEVMVHARIERCSGDLCLGDLVHSTTLFPGEKVRMFTMDRKRRFSLDTSSNVSYRHEQTQEEQYYMSSFSDFMSDVTVRDEGRASNQRRGSASTSANTSGAIQSFIAGASIDVKGEYNAESTSDFLREMSQHAESSHNRSIESVRTANSVSVGEVSTRTHAEGESEDHFESSSRVFSNPNRCHAITFFFYQINKKQTVRFTIESIQRRVIDPAADAKFTNNTFSSRGDVSVIPTAVLATDASRLESEQAGRESVVLQATSLPISTLNQAQPGVASFATAASFARAQTDEPLDAATRKAALDAVDKELMRVGLLNKNRELDTTVKQRLSFEVTTSIPTAGLQVKSCLDECNVCEPALLKEIDLELENKALQNQLLKKQIELLAQSQEYRCCPVGEKEEVEG